MTPKLIFLYPAPARAFDLETRGPVALAQRGFDVEVFDLTRLFHPRLAPSAVSTASSPAVHIQSISTFGELENNIARIGHNACYLDYVVHVNGITLATSRLFRLIKKYHARYVVIYIGELPWAPPVRTGSACAYHLRRLINGLSRPRKIFDLLLAPLFAALVSRDLLYPRPWRIYTSSPTGIARTFAHRYGIPSSSIVPVPSHDCEAYWKVLKMQTCRTDQIPPYCVYIDEDLTGSLDFPMLGTQSLSPHVFRSSMARLFDRVETIFGIDVVIAAHPRSVGTGDYRLFAERRIFHSRTIELIAGASLVIAHYSTVLGVAALAHKPVLLIKTKEMSGGICAMIDGYAKTFGAPVILADDDAQLAQLFPGAISVYPDKCEAFVRRYLNPTGQHGCSVWDIMAKDLQTIALS